MALATYQISAFSGGEWGQFAQGRTDRPDYKYAMSVCLNGIPIELGTWVRRPGTRWIANTYLGAEGRLFSFAFKDALPYTIELSCVSGLNAACRFIAPTQSVTGLNLVDTNDGKLIVSISTATPAVVQTASAHGWSSNDHITIPTIPFLQNREFIIAVIDSTHFSISDQITGYIDGSQIGVLPTGALALRALVISTPYTAVGTTTGVDQVRKAQAETTAFLFHPAVAPQALVVSTNPVNAVTPVSGPFAQFTLEAVDFLDGPYLDQYVGTTITPTGTSGTITLQASGGSTFPGFAASDVGRLIRLFSQPQSWSGATTYSAGNVVGYYTDPINDPSGATYYVALQTVTGNPPQISPTFWALVTGTQYAVWTWGVITAVNSSSNVSVSVKGAGLLYNSTVIYAWNFGAYGGANGYPTCAVYYQGRLWMGGAIDNRVDGSVANGIIGNVVNMAPTAADGTVGAASAIAAVFDADDVNPVMWMAHHQQGIICGTQGGEFLVYAPSPGGIAPNNIDASRVTQIGGANTEVRYAEHTLIFVQRYGRKIVEYFADVFSGKLSGPNLSLLWKHLTKGGIAEIAYQQELSPTIWVRVPPNQYTASGLIGSTYKRETLASAQGPTLNGAHRHVLGSGRVVESISAGPSASGTSDALLMITNDPGTNVRQIEVLTDILDEGSTLLDACYVDNAVAPLVGHVTANTLLPYGGLLLSGLWPLNGQIVSAWAGGLDCGDYQVVNGAITVPYGDGVRDGTAKGLFTATYVASIPGIPIWVGYTYTSQGQLVRPTAPQEAGSRNGPAFGKLRRHHYAFVQVEGAVSSSISLGFDNYPPMPLKFTNANPPTELPPTTQVTGVFRLQPQDGDTFDGELRWQVTRPYPCNIVSVGGALDTKDV